MFKKIASALAALSLVATPALAQHGHFGGGHFGGGHNYNHDTVNVYHNNWGGWRGNHYHPGYGYRAGGFGLGLGLGLAGGALLYDGYGYPGYNTYGYYGYAPYYNYNTCPYDTHYDYSYGECLPD